MWSFLPRIERRLVRLLLAYLVTPLAGTLVSLVLLSRLTHVWQGPDTYTIYVVGNFDGSVAQQVYAGIQEAASALAALSLDGTRIGIKSVNDHRDASKAKAIAQKLAHAPDALL